MGRGDNGGRESQAGAWVALGVMTVLTLAAAGVVRGQSANAALSVSVTVVRSCSVSTPASASRPSAAPSGTVTISCGRTRAAAPVGPAFAVIPVVGTAAGATVSTVQTSRHVVVNVDF